MVASQPGGPQKYWPCGSSHRTFWGTASQNDAKNVKIKGKKMGIKRAMLKVIVKSNVKQEQYGCKMQREVEGSDTYQSGRAMPNFSRHWRI